MGAKLRAPVRDRARLRRLSAPVPRPGGHAFCNIVGGLVGRAGRVALGQVGAYRDRCLAAALATGGTTGPGAQSDQRALLGRVAGLVAEGDGVAAHCWYPAQPPRFTVQDQHADVSGVAAPRSLNPVTVHIQLRF